MANHTVDCEECGRDTRGLSGGHADDCSRGQADGSKIIKGLEDALAYSQGDETRGRSSTVYVRPRKSYKWLILEEVRLNEEVARLRDIIRRRLNCDGSHGRYHAGELEALTKEMNGVTSE